MFSRDLLLFCEFAFFYFTNTPSVSQRITYFTFLRVRCVLCEKFIMSSIFSKKKNEIHLVDDNMDKMICEKKLHKIMFIRRIRRQWTAECVPLEIYYVFNKVDVSLRLFVSRHTSIVLAFNQTKLSIHKLKFPPIQSKQVFVHKKPIKKIFFVLVFLSLFFLLSRDGSRIYALCVNRKKFISTSTISIQINDYDYKLFSS